jgi:hypothetical protein
METKTVPCFFVGGLSPFEEACGAYLFYYPQLPSLVRCESTQNIADFPFPSLGSLLIDDAAENGQFWEPTLKSPSSVAGQPFRRVLNENVTWTETLKAEFQIWTRATPQTQSCVKEGDGQLVVVANKNNQTDKVLYPQNFTAHLEPARKCGRRPTTLSPAHSPTTPPPAQSLSPFHSRSVSSAATVATQRLLLLLTPALLQFLL